MQVRYVVAILTGHRAALRMNAFFLHPPDLFEMVPVQIASHLRSAVKVIADALAPVTLPGRGQLWYQLYSQHPFRFTPQLSPVPFETEDVAFVGFGHQTCVGFRTETSIPTVNFKQRAVGRFQLRHYFGKHAALVGLRTNHYLIKGWFAGRRDEHRSHYSHLSVGRPLFRMDQLRPCRCCRRWPSPDRFVVYRYYATRQTHRSQCLATPLAAYLRLQLPSQTGHFRLSKPLHKIVERRVGHSLSARHRRQPLHTPQ